MSGPRHQARGDAEIASGSLPARMAPEPGGLGPTAPIMPDVSVIMAVRDGSRWLAGAIASLQCQTFSNFELIIVDDGSGDESPRIMEDRARADPRIRIIRQERLGLAAALNSGLAASNG